MIAFISEFTGRTRTKIKMTSRKKIKRENGRKDSKD